MGAKQGRGLRNLLQSHQAGALSGAQAFQTNGCQNAIFASQGDHIRNGSQGDQIQQGTQVEVSRAEDTGFAGALKQSVGEFEGEPNGAELCKGRAGILGFAGIAGRGKPWIDQSNGRRRGHRDLVMVQHDDLHAALAQPGNRSDRCRTAIHG